MKDYIIQRQHVLPTTELLALTTQTQNNTEEIRQIKQQVNDLAVVINDFTDNNVKDDISLRRFLQGWRQTGDFHQQGGGYGTLPKHSRQFGGESGVAVVNASFRNIPPLRVLPHF